MTKNIAIAIAFLSGAGLVFIGARFLIAPETAEVGYGIHFNERGNYSFHYIKGIRDLLSGLLICIFVLSKQTKALAISLLVGTIVPVVDMLIVLGEGYTDITQAIPHLFAIIICFVFGIVLLCGNKKHANNYEGYAKIIQSSDTDKITVIEFNIIPCEKTPWHYHSLFSETIEVLNGTLEVGLNSQVYQLKQGDIVTIKPNEKHYFHNISNDQCLIKVTVSAGNKNFEKSLLILKGLAKDGLANASGTPRKISDLALFIYLNNSRMVGLQKIAEPLFHYFASKSIKNGHLKELELKYCKGRNYCY